MTGEATNQQKRERLWASPHCVRPSRARGLFDNMGDDA